MRHAIVSTFRVASAVIRAANRVHEHRCMRGNPIKEERRLEDFELHQERSPVRSAREIDPRIRNLPELQRADMCEDLIGERAFVGRWFYQSARLFRIILPPRAFVDRVRKLAAEIDEVGLAVHDHRREAGLHEKIALCVLEMMNFNRSEIPARNANCCEASRRNRWLHDEFTKLREVSSPIDFIACAMQHGWHDIETSLRELDEIRLVQVPTKHRRAVDQTCRSGHAIDPRAKPLEMREVVPRRSHDRRVIRMPLDRLVFPRDDFRGDTARRERPDEDCKIPIGAWKFTTCHKRETHDGQVLRITVRSRPPLGTRKRPIPTHCVLPQELAQEG